MCKGSDSGEVAVGTEAKDGRKKIENLLLVVGKLLVTFPGKEQLR